MSTAEYIDRLCTICEEQAGMIRELMLQIEQLKAVDEAMNMAAEGGHEDGDNHSGCNQRGSGDNCLRN